MFIFLFSITKVLYFIFKNPYSFYSDLNCFFMILRNLNIFYGLYVLSFKLLLTHNLLPTHYNILPVFLY